METRTGLTENRRPVESRSGVFPVLNFDTRRLPSGIRLRVGTYGEPENPAILWLHGYTDSWFSFSRILPLLPADVQVVVPDQRGHGESDKPADGYSVNEFAWDAVHLLDLVGIDSATVAGHSMGSFVAQRMAVIAPERVARLVLVGSAARIRNAAVLELAEAVAAFSEPVPVEFVRDFQQSTCYRPVPAAFLDRVVSESRKVPSRVWKSILSRMLSSDWTTDVGRIRCPTLVLGGDRDAVFSRSEQEALAASIPRATLSIRTEVGHSPHWETPEEFTKELLAFMGLREMH
jgi:pimeloyl-ACP methyl ester carboxylesterase